MILRIKKVNYLLQFKMFADRSRWQSLRVTEKTVRPKCVFSDNLFTTHSFRRHSFCVGSHDMDGHLQLERVDF